MRERAELHRRGASHTLRVELDEFGWSRLADEARDQGVPPEDLAVHAIIYYLADLDSGRLARRALRDAGTGTAA